MKTSELDARGGKMTSRLYPAVLLAVAFVLAAGLIAMIVWGTAHDPQQMLDQALDVCPADPVRGLALIEASIKAAGGRFTEAQLLKCRILVKLDRAAEAAEGFLAIDDWPDKQRTSWLPRLRELVEAEFDADQEKLALEHCEKFALLAPESPVPWLMTASILRQNGDLKGALKAYQNALTCNPGPNESWQIGLEIVKLALQTGDITVAREQVDRLLTPGKKSQMSEADEETLQGLHAAVLFQERANTDALAVVDRLLARWPESAGGRFVRGSIYLEQGRYEEAVEDLDRVVRLDPLEKTAHYKLGQAYLGLKEPEKAESHLAISHRLTQLQVQILQLQDEFQNDPNNRQLAIQLADLNEQVGKTGMANYWRRAAARRHSPPVSRYR